MSTPAPAQFQIFVDGKHFTVPESALTGAQIKALVGRDAQYKLFQEVPGGHDLEIQDSQSVSLRNGLHFFTVANASFGAVTP